MFKQIGQLLSLMKNSGKLKEEMEKFQGKLGQITGEGEAGAGMVKARVNGHLELVSCVLSEDALKQGDREFLEDLIKAAVNQALKNARQSVAEETAKMAAEIGLPPGMNLPGMS